MDVSVVKVRPMAVSVRDFLMFVPVRMARRRQKAGMGMRMMAVVMPVAVRVGQTLVVMLVTVLVAQQKCDGSPH